MIVASGILVSSVLAVLLLRVVLLREFRIRLFWPSLVLAWLLIGSSLLFTVGVGLLPGEAGIVVISQNYPGFLYIGMLFVAALGGWLCRPIRHIFAERLPQS